MTGSRWKICKSQTWSGTATCPRASWTRAGGYLKTHLTHKAVEAGRVVYWVNPAGTSNTCSQSGHVFEHLTLADRWVLCVCGLSMDRNHNAARNILDRAGHARWGQSTATGLG